MFKKLCLPALLLALMPLQSFARNYSVEAIIFSNTVMPDTVRVEWDERAPRNIKMQSRLDTLYRQAKEAAEARAAADTQEQQAGDAKEAPVRTEVSHVLSELLSLQEKLEQSPDHEILQTLSWKQSEANYQASPLINTITPHMMGVLRVYAPNLLFAELNLLYTPGEILKESLATEEVETTRTPLPEPGPITDPAFVSFSSDATGVLQAAPEPIVERYYLDEQRKLKLNEIHYFDHPRFGVILSVRPLKDNQAEATE